MYMPEIFDCATVEDAAAIILTPESGLTTEGRWLRETPYFTKLLKDNLNVNPNEVGYRRVVDFGCGIGRLSLPLVEAGYHVLGVDASPTMRAMAVDFVSDAENFSVLTPAELFAESKVDAIFAVWALQHVLNIEETLQSLVAMLKPSARLVVIGSKRRCVPMKLGWSDDKFDIPGRLSELLTPVYGLNLNPAKVGDQTAGSSYFGVWEKEV